MLDIRQIRSDAEAVCDGLRARGAETHVDRIIDLDTERRAVLAEVEQLESERNAASKEIGRLKKAGEDAEDKMAAMRELGERVATLDTRRRTVEEELEVLLLTVPNVPDEDTPPGHDASCNVEVREWGEKPTFDFEPADHVSLGGALDILDMERAARMSGAGFPLLVGLGAQLERALVQFMLDLHTREHGYVEVAPPLLCGKDAMTGTGQLPKMADDMYHVEEDGLYLIPTAEVTVTNIYRDEIMEKPLPVYHVAHTPCFRREAGAAGKDTRGMARVHQFQKVEMVKFVDPETSDEELESLVANAETVLQRLGLAYRVLRLCAGDLSFAAAKCYDIELWAPGYGDWLEVSSCSNFRDFQARRAGIRFRGADRKPQYVHTLNGSGVALPRLIIALLEQGQQADGSVILPEAIRPYMHGLERLSPVRQPY